MSNADPVVIELEDDKDIELEGTIPENFVTGEEKELTLTVRNNNSEDAEVNLLLGGDMEGPMAIEYEKPLLIAQGDNTVTVKIKASKDPEKNAIGSGKSGEIRIQGLNNPKAKITGKYSLTQFSNDKLKISLGGSNNKSDYGTVRAGENKDRILKVENENSFDITGIKAEVKITNTEFSDPQEVGGWFKFSPENTMDVAADSEGQLTLVLTIPLAHKFPEGKEKEAITGALYLRTSYF